MYVGYLDSPLGLLKIVASSDYLLEVDLVYEKDGENRNYIVEKCIRELEEYFNGKRKEFSVKYKLTGTAFQNKVWSCLAKVPYASKVSYKDLALAIENPGAIRAVGTAVGKNKLLIIVPCHRVLNTGSGLGGFSAGGLENKKKLLRLEKII